MMNLNDIQAGARYHQQTLLTEAARQRLTRSARTEHRRPQGNHGTVGTAALGRSLASMLGRHRVAAGSRRQEA